jgi:hypothetical protein
MEGDRSCSMPPDERPELTQLKFISTQRFADSKRDSPPCGILLAAAEKMG